MINSIKWLTLPEVRLLRTYRQSSNAACCSQCGGWPYVLGSHAVLPVRVEVLLHVDGVGAARPLLHRSLSLRPELLQISLQPAPATRI